MPQYQLEAVMRRKVAQLPTVKMLFERTVKKVDKDSDGVRVTLDSQTWRYDDEVLEAEYFVGCDGARSLVREQAGTNFEQRMALVVFPLPRASRCPGALSARLAVSRRRIPRSRGNRS
jgi:2-polyprenyl-6-methoxyphenol hydroxylase-like FAD-dependent oxidoreductase